MTDAAKLAKARAGLPPEILQLLDLVLTRGFIGDELLLTNLCAAAFEAGKVAGITQSQAIFNAHAKPAA